MADKRLTGRIAAERIRMQSTPKPPKGAVERFLKLGDCCGLVSLRIRQSLTRGRPRGLFGSMA